MKKQNKKRKTKRVIPQVKLSCPFNGNPDLIDYKDTQRLKKFVTTRGSILPTGKTGVSAKCQRKLALSIKRAKFMAMLPYANYV